MITSVSINTLRESVKRMDLGPVPELWTVETDWNRGGSLSTSGSTAVLRSW